MGLFGGGGSSIDTEYANSLVEKSQRLQQDLNADLTRMNYPFYSLGSGSADKLADLLGVAGKTDQTYYKQFMPANVGVAGDGTYYANKGWDRYEVRDDGLYNSKNQRSYYGDPNITWSDWERIDTPEPAPPSENFGDLLKDFTIEDYEESPNYQFNLAEGQKAIDRATAARGAYNSPAAVKDLARYSQDLASNEYLNSYNMDAQNKSRTFDMLMGATGTGQQAVGQQSVNNINYGNTMDQLYGQQGQLDLASQAAKASSRGSTFGSLAGIAGSVLGGVVGGPVGSAIGGKLGSAAFGGGGGSFNPLSLLSSAAGMYGASSGIMGGFDPMTGVTWNSGRYA